MLCVLWRQGLSSFPSSLYFLEHNRCLVYVWVSRVFASGIGCWDGITRHGPLTCSELALSWFCWRNIDTCLLCSHLKRSVWAKMWNGQQRKRARWVPKENPMDSGCAWFLRHFFSLFHMCLPYTCNARLAPVVTV